MARHEADSGHRRYRATGWRDRCTCSNALGSTPPWYATRSRPPRKAAGRRSRPRRWDPASRIRRPATHRCRMRRIPKPQAKTSEQVRADVMGSRRALTPRVQRQHLEGLHPGPWFQDFDPANGTGTPVGVSSTKYPNFVNGEGVWMIAPCFEDNDNKVTHGTALRDGERKARPPCLHAVTATQEREFSDPLAASSTWLVAHSDHMTAHGG